MSLFQFFITANIKVHAVVEKYLPGALRELASDKRESFYIDLGEAIKQAAREVLGL